MLKDFIKIEVVGTDKSQRKVTGWQGSVGETHRTWERTCWPCAPASRSPAEHAGTHIHVHEHTCACTRTGTHACRAYTWAHKYRGMCAHIRPHMGTGTRAHTQGVARFILLNRGHGEPCCVRALTGFSGGRSPDLVLLVRWLRARPRWSQDAKQKTWVLTYVSYKKIKN